jgi:aldehyde:ferredoxin oxidoreductase
MVVGKSPLTGGWGDANCGGHFGPVLRSAGLDGVFVRGIAERPVVLMIDGDQVTIEDAKSFWGLDTWETEKRLKERVGRGAQVLTIGPAGENQSLIAAIITDGGRAAARSGLAAVMGSKRLKALVVRGRQRVPVHDKEALTEVSRDYGRIFKKPSSPLSRVLFGFTKTFAPLIRLLGVKPSGPADAIIYLYRKYGTSGATAFTTEVGDAPVGNWRGVAARDYPLRRSRRVSDEAVIEYQVENYGCRYCPVACGGIVHMDGERYHVEEAHKPEYETLAAFGPLLLNDDLESIVKINSLCDRFGLDTISTGTVAAFAMECAEHGLIDRKLEDGVELSWGNGEAVIRLVRSMAHREGIGDLLADGVQRAAEQIGGEAHSFAMHAGGQELPMHDSRYEPGLGLAYAVDPTPGRHNTANGGILDAPILREMLAAEALSPPKRYAYEKKGTEFALLNRYLQVLNCAGLCMFSLVMSEPPLLDWLNGATGWGWSLEEMLQAGHRIQVMRHAFNLREGLPADGFRLPARAVGRPPLRDGPLRDVTLDLEAMKRDYFDCMGYDSDGVPTRELLESLGLSAIIEDLEEMDRWS